MEIYKDLILLKRSGSTSLPLQLSKALLALIQKGSIQPNDRVPPVRKMAALLKVHPKTVVAAYDDLVAQNWLESIPRKGTYVSSVLPIVKPLEPFPAQKSEIAKKSYKSSGLQIDSKTHLLPQLLIDDGFPDHRLPPWDLIMREYKRLKSRAYATLLSMYGDPSGSEELRLVLSRYLRETRALPVGAEDLCITRGAQMGLYLLCRTLVKSGSKVIVADPNYTLANDVLKECGATVIPVAVESDGIAVEEMSRLCKKEKIDGIYLIPHHHHPTTVCLSPQKRIAVLELAEKHNLFIIEDDYDYDYHYDTSPILPLASYANAKRIFYIGSLSKVLSNSLRLGFIYCNASIKNEVVRMRRLIDLRGDTFLELAIAEFFKSGDFERHIKRSSKIYRERRDFMYDLLTQDFGNYISAEKPKGGMAIWAKFDSSIDLPELSKRAARIGLGISDGTFYNNHINLNSIRIGFASKNIAEIDQFGELLKSALKK